MKVSWTCIPLVLFLKPVCGVFFCVWKEILWTFHQGWLKEKVYLWNLSVPIKLGTGRQHQVFAIQKYQKMWLTCLKIAEFNNLICVPTYGGRGGTQASWDNVPTLTGFGFWKLSLMSIKLLNTSMLPSISKETKVVDFDIKVSNDLYLSWHSLSKAVWHICKHLKHSFQKFDITTFITDIVHHWGS